MSAGDDQDPLPLFAEDAAWDDVQAALEAFDLADGLPQTPPTERRLAEMLGDADAPDEPLDLMPPLFGGLTPRAVAYNCVLAGCAPGALPVVMAAARACLAPEFNLLGLLTTTGTPAIAVIVHGPAATALGMNAGGNCLGPGNRANAALGRAVALVTRNIGGARAGVGDMATMGQPGKYGFCFAESDADLLPPLPSRLGLEPGASAVTVLGVSGTVEVLPLDDRDTGEAILSPIAAAMLGTGALAGSGRKREPGDQVFLLPPELAEALRDRGWDLARVQDFLFAAHEIEFPGVVHYRSDLPVARSARDIHPILTGGAGVKMTYLPLWAGGSLIQTREIEALGR